MITAFLLRSLDRRISIAIAILLLVAALVPALNLLTGPDNPLHIPTYIMALFGKYLNLPSDPLPGDLYTPRASGPRVGPSERMVVSPGHEQDGILHIPTGQSGHPLSPHYGDQYRAWLNGEPTPFLPGPKEHSLTLVPM